MANKEWIGAAQPVAQVTTVTFSAYTSGVTYYLTVNNKRVSYTAVASTSADVWAGLSQAWNQSTYPEHVEAIASVSSGVVLTSRTAGVPFTVTGSSSSTPTATVTGTQAATGPNHFDNAANWSGGTAPGVGDNLIFKNSDVDVLYNIDTSGTAYGNMTFEASYTGQVGLPATNTSGASSYPEYRQQSLKIASSATPTIRIGAGDGSQASLIRLDLNGANAVLVVDGTARAGTSRPVEFKNPGSTSTLAFHSGSLAVLSDSTSTIASVSVIKQESQQSSAPDLQVGAGVTVTSLISSGGSIENYGTITTADLQEGATLTNNGTVGTLNVASNSRAYMASSTGIGTQLRVYDGGLVDFSRNSSARTVAAAEVYKGGSLSDPLGVVTWTAGIDLVGCKIADVTLDLGRSRTLNV